MQEFKLNVTSLLPECCVPTPGVYVLFCSVLLCVEYFFMFCCMFLIQQSVCVLHSHTFHSSGDNRKTGAVGIWGKKNSLGTLVGYHSLLRCKASKGFLFIVWRSCLFWKYCCLQLHLYYCTIWRSCLLLKIRTVSCSQRLLKALLFLAPPSAPGNISLGMKIEAEFILLEVF